MKQFPPSNSQSDLGQVIGTPLIGLQPNRRHEGLPALNAISMMLHSAREGGFKIFNTINWWAHSNAYLGLWVWTSAIAIWSRMSQKQKSEIPHRAHTLSWSASGTFASIFGFKCFLFFVFLLRHFLRWGFFRHFLRFRPLSSKSSSLLSSLSSSASFCIMYPARKTGILSTTFSLISSRTLIETAKWQVSFFDAGILWRTSIWKTNDNGRRY